MKIGFDISQTCESKSGTGFFADQMIRSVAKIDEKNQYTLFPWFYDYRPKTVDNCTKIERPNFHEAVIDEFSDTQKEIKQLDIVHSNNYRFPVGITAKKVVTIYDVCFMDHPEYTTEANRLFCYKGTLDSMMFADKIIAISEYTRDRLEHFFPSVPKDKIEVILLGNRDTLLKEKEDMHILEKFHLEKDAYFLSVGTIEPRKNYGTLLNAYKRYKESIKGYKKLCIAGGYGWMQENFYQDIADMGLEQDVIVTGYVSDLELSNLYRNCFAFMYPTWYEGFGLPVLEAMNFGKPVITSNVTSIPEITGDAALLVDPGNVDQFTESMLLLEKDGEKRSELSSKGFQRTKLFSWEKAAWQLLQIYEEIVL